MEYIRYLVRNEELNNTRLTYHTKISRWGNDFLKEPFIEKPGLWFALNLLLWFAVAYSLKVLMEKLTERSNSVLIVRFKANLPINLENLYKYLRTKQLKEEEVGIEQQVTIKKVSWTEENTTKWGDSLPNIEVNSHIIFWVVF
jgi:hypothetical protein